MKIYYHLLQYHPEEGFSPQFGDYDLEVVEQEKLDYLDEAFETDASEYVYDIYPLPDHIQIESFINYITEKG